MVKTMSPLKFLRQIKLLPLAAAVTSSPRRISGSGRFNHLYTLTSPCGIKSQLHLPFPKYFDLIKFSWPAAKKLCISGQKLRYGSMLVFALIGSKNTTLQSGYCEDDQHVFLSYPRTRTLTASAIEENILGEFLLIRKLLVPVFLLLTVWLNWGISPPVFVAAKVALIFLCTKPFPSSVHMFVEQLRHQIISRHPLEYRFNPSQVKLIEVEDCMFLCLARALVKDEKLVFIGILGGWWILPLSSGRELFLMNMTSPRELISLIKSRFRVEVVTEILMSIFLL